MTPAPACGAVQGRIATRTRRSRSDQGEDAEKGMEPVRHAIPLCPALRSPRFNRNRAVEKSQDGKRMAAIH